MNKFFSLLLTLMLCSSVATADTITIDLDTATAYELEAVRDAIDGRLAELRTLEVPSADGMNVISGSGTQILNGFNITSHLSRLVAKCEKDTKLTLYVDGMDRPLTYGEYGESQSSYAEYFNNPLSISSMMVETTGDWSFEFSPIDKMSSPYISGSGSYVTDMFTVSPPCIVTITLSCKKWSDLCSVSLISIDSKGELGYESMIDWGTYISGTESFDIIIKPEKNVVAYFWCISCSENIDWKFTAK